ncbi:MAG TPA: anti-sigma factor [Dehalococcoidia bacterium]|nr:anti-sigma factor [Dehalococcoidia bacterium]
MDCQEARQALDLLALGALPEDEASPVEQHLASCAECSRYLEGSRQVAARLGLATPVLEPPPRLRRRILAAARGPGTAGVPRQRLAWGVMAALTAAAVALSAFFFVEWRQAQDERQDLADQLSDALAAVRERDELMQLFTLPDLARVPMLPQSPGLAANLSYYWSTQKRWGFIVGTALPPPPPGRVYQLWFLSSEGSRGVGTFRPSESGTVYHSFDLSVLPPNWRPSAIAVTLEPEGGSPVPTGETVAVGTLTR